VEPVAARDELVQEGRHPARLAVVGLEPPAVGLDVDGLVVARHQVGEVLPEREPPHPVPGVHRRRQHVLPQRLRVAEHSAGRLPQRLLHVAGHGAHVDDQAGPEVLGVDEGVGEAQPPPGVGGLDLDALAVHGLDDVAGAHRRAPWHVLAEGDEGADVERELQAGDRSAGGDHARGAAHVAPHFLLLAAGLQAEAAAVVGDALADQHHGTLVSRRPVVTQLEEDRGLARALRHRQEGEHLLGLGPAAHLHLDVDARLAQHLDRVLGERSGGHVVGGGVHQLPGQVLGGGLLQADLPAGPVAVVPQLQLRDQDLVLLLLLLLEEPHAEGGALGGGLGVAEALDEDLGQAELLQGATSRRRRYPDGLLALVHLLEHVVALAFAPQPYYRHRTNLVLDVVEDADFAFGGWGPGVPQQVQQPAAHHSVVSLTRGGQFSWVQGVIGVGVQAQNQALVQVALAGVFIFALLAADGAGRRS
jgi:hypothetical protein